MGDPICDVIVAMMRYSEIPRDLSSDSLRFAADIVDDKLYRNLRDESPQSDYSNYSETALPLISEKGGDEDDIRPSPAPSKSAQKKHSITSIASIDIISRNNSTSNYYELNGTTLNKSQSLPPNSSIQNLDPVIINALRVSPEDLAHQITILDFPCFAQIQPDEFTSCAWMKKDKYITAPNIVAFTKRFNHTSFWTVQEILNVGSPKDRAEVLAHFIKVAKKLYEMNNLHSLFAVTSAMKSASIYRLSKTWACLSKKDKHTFDRLSDIFNEDNNWAVLREYLESLKLPCIPYLGLFLTDLVYIDLAHPHKGGLEPEQRRTKMNNILRVISSYQGSDYSHIVPNQRIQKYLQSIRYIEELQNIFEDDQYKQSLKLEPPPPSNVVQSSSSCSSKESVAPVGCHLLDPNALASLNLSPAKSSSMRVASTCTSTSKFIPGHRKCRSLGSKFRSTSLPRNFHQNCHCPPFKSISGNGGGGGSGLTSSNRCKCRIFNKINNQVTPTIQRNDSFHLSRHLLDDSVLEDKQLQAFDSISNASSEGAVGFETDGETIINETFGFQGSVRRKTILKDKRKPAVASWQRYWLQIWANSLVYFPPKSFKGSERGDYKREPCKVCSLEGWTAEPIENSQQTNTFQLMNPHLGHAYKFRTGSPEMTKLWLNALRRVSNTYTEKPLPTNLISFE